MALLVCQRFVELVHQQSDHPAFLYESDRGIESLTWNQLGWAVVSMMSRLQEHQLQSGDHVASYLPNSLAWICTDLACQIMGLVHVAIDASQSIEHATSLSSFAEAKLFLTDDETLPHSRVATISNIDLTLSALVRADRRSYAIEALRQCERIRPEQPAQMLFTSGTVGQQKGVLLSHGNLSSNAIAKLGAAPQRADDVRLNILPFAHAYARTCELSTWILGGSQLAIARNWDDFLRIAPRIAPTLINLVPHLVQRLVREIENGELTESSDKPWHSMLGQRVRLLQVGGAALSNELWQKLNAWGLPPLQGYGLTETSPVICSNIAGKQRPSTVGPAVPGVEVRIDAEGILWTRGPHVMLGYWKDEKATGERVVDGWLNTGDLAEQFGNGTLRILGRSDDTIVLSTGYKVGPNEILRTLGDDDWVEQTLVVGNGRPYVGLLVAPRVENVPCELTVEIDGQRVIDEDRFVEALRLRWQPLVAALPRPIRPELIGLLRERLTVENRCLNFKGGQRRRHAEQFFADDINRLYRSIR